MNVSTFVKEASPLLDSFLAKAEADDILIPLDSKTADECEALLVELKIKMIRCGSCQPVVPKGHMVDTSELLLARKVLEAATMFYLRTENFTMVERTILQLHSYYLNYGMLLPPSPNESTIISLYLLLLLLSDRFGDFHLFLEGVSPSRRSESAPLAFVVELETHMTEGNYAKILKSSDSVPVRSFNILLKHLSIAIRESAAAAMAAAYHSYPVEDTLKRLMIRSVTELEAFCKERNAKAKSAINVTDVSKGFGAAIGLDTETQEKEIVQWEICGDTIFFTSQDEAKRSEQLKPLQIMNQALGYAKEFDRIV